MAERSFKSWLDKSVLDGDYQVIAVWHGTILPERQVVREEFQKWMLDTFGARVRVVGLAKTEPDTYGPGGRADLLFAIHNDDVSTFAVKRLSAGFRWLEDVILNTPDVYTKEIKELVDAIEPTD